MNNNVEYNCVKPLKGPGDPIIIYALPQEAEAVANACRDVGINVAAFCDKEKSGLTPTEAKERNKLRLGRLICCCWQKMMKV